MEILEKIRQIREQKKISRKEMGEFLSITGDTYRDIEIGRIRLNLENFILICEKLDTNPIELLNQSKDEHFILLNNRDINDLNRIINKINNQAFTINNSGNDVSINVNNNFKEK